MNLKVCIRVTVSRADAARFESLPLCKMPFHASEAAFLILGTNYGTKLPGIKVV